MGILGIIAYYEDKVRTNLFCLVDVHTCLTPNCLASYDVEVVITVLPRPDPMTAMGFPEIRGLIAVPLRQRRHPYRYT